MADLGTLPAGPTMTPPTGSAIGAYSPINAQKVDYGSLPLLLVGQVAPTFTVDDYRIAGTVNMPDPYSPPTIGQLWPRGDLDAE